LKNILLDQDELPLFNILTLKYEKDNFNLSEVKEYEEKLKILIEKCNNIKDNNSNYRESKLLEYITGTNSISF
jgi:hypothetical protein